MELLQDYAQWQLGADKDNSTPVVGMDMENFSAYVKSVFTNLNSTDDPSEVISCFTSGSEIDAFFNSIRDYGL